MHASVTSDAIRRHVWLTPYVDSDGETKMIEINRWENALFVGYAVIMVFLITAIPVSSSEEFITDSSAGVDSVPSGNASETQIIKSWAWDLSGKYTSDCVGPWPPEKKNFNWGDCIQFNTFISVYLYPTLTVYYGVQKPDGSWINLKPGGFTFGTYPAEWTAYYKVNLPASGPSGKFAYATVVRDTDWRIETSGYPTDYWFTINQSAES